MIVMFIIMIVPWIIWIALAFQNRKLKWELKNIKYNSVTMDDFDKMREERDMFMNDYINEINKRDAKEKNTIPKVKFNPKNLSYSELEACTNYFVENQHKLKLQPK